MAAHASWEGYIKFSLISIPVRAYNSAMPNRGVISFHQLHKDCGERIQYKKVCPVHGEVTKDDIISGYEVSKGEYVEIEKKELEGIRAEDEESIDIDAFVSPDSIDPVYFSGRTHYLVPSGPAGQKAYSLLNRVMSEKGVLAVAHMVLSGHEEPVLIRPSGKLLELAVLYYESQVKAPSGFAAEVAETEVSGQELKLATQLVEESVVQKYDFSQLKDRYTERVAALIEAKSHGKAPHKPRKADKAPKVINLMDALKKSLAATHTKKASVPHRTRKKTG